jgi:hypothetical protein
MELLLVLTFVVVTFGSTIAAAALGSRVCTFGSILSAAVKFGSILSAVTIGGC